MWWGLQILGAHQGKQGNVGLKSKVPTFKAGGKEAAPPKVTPSSFAEDCRLV